MSPGGSQTRAPRASERGEGVKSAERVMAILDLLAADGPLTFSEIVGSLKLPKSSAHALLRTMQEHSYLAFDETNKRYRLGGRIWQLAQSGEKAEELRTLLQPLMDRLVERTEETVQLAVLDGSEVVYVGLSESPHPVKLTSRPGVRLPAHVSAIGKALLADLDPEDAARRLGSEPLEQLTAHTIVDRDALLKELQRVRERGYSVDNEEFAVGLRCVAMALHDGRGRAVGALSVSIPTPRCTRTVFADARQALAETIEQAGERLRDWAG